MRAERVVVGATVLLLVGLAVAAGPLVGLPILDTESAEPGTGSMTATVEGSPERGTLEAKNYGDGGYSLRGPPIVVTLADLSGRPYLTYTLSVPGLNHSTTSLTAFEEAGRHRLTMSPSTLAADRVDQDAYNGTLTVHVIDDDGRRAIIETEVVIEVRE